MAHLWNFSESGGWTPLALGSASFAIVDGQPVRVSDLTSGATEPPPLAIRHVGDGDNISWILITRPGATVRVNGVAAALGIVALADRDEIRAVDGSVLFFSNETLARVEPLPASVVGGFCPRCKQRIAADEPAVRCPACGLWHHESEAMPCWTYGPHCAACSQETALDAGFRWTPEEL